MGAAPEAERLRNPTTDSCEETDLRRVGAGRAPQSP